MTTADFALAHLNLLYIPAAASVVGRLGMRGDVFRIVLAGGIFRGIPALVTDVRTRLSRSVLHTIRIAWVPPASIHLTIKFLGDMDEAVIEPLRVAITQAMEGPRTIHIPLERLGVALRRGPSTAGAATNEGDISKSIRGVFGRLDKMGDVPSKGQQGRRQKATAPAAKSAASGKGRQSAVASAAQPEASRIVTLSKIRVGMSREELLALAGRPSMKTSGTDEGVFAETYTYDIYQGHIDEITITLHDGKVSRVPLLPGESDMAASPRNTISDAK